MEFPKSSELRSESQFTNSYNTLDAAVKGAMYTAVGSHLYTCTVSTGSALPEDVQNLICGLESLGYTINLTTTPGSLVISW